MGIHIFYLFINQLEEASQAFVVYTTNCTFAHNIYSTSVLWCFTLYLSDTEYIEYRIEYKIDTMEVQNFGTVKVYHKYLDQILEQEPINIHDSYAV